MRIGILFILIIGLFSPAGALIIYVPEDYPTIPEAIEASIDGDTVMVGSGNFQEPIRFFGKGILLTSRYGPDSTQVGRVTIEDGEDSTTILRGFRIHPATRWLPVEVVNANGAIIEANDVSGNTSYVFPSGGIYASGGILIRSNVISNNMSYWGRAGGVHIGWNSVLIGNIISGNEAENWETPGGANGGGILIAGSEIICAFNLVINNCADDWDFEYPDAEGGGIYAVTGYNGSNILIINNTVVGNRAVLFGEYSDRGGGIALNTFYRSVLKNNIIASNVRGGGVDVVPFSASNYCDYNDIWGNAPYNYNENYVPGDGDIFVDPLFVDPENGDYHLQSGSPCIDAGDPNSPLDPDSTRADIGSYFYDHSTDILETDEPSGPHEFYLKQNYPNPFNGETIISYYLPQDAFVELNIINMRGELVAKPVNSRQSSGNHTLTWPGTRSDGTPVSTGIYFYELKVAESRDIKVMILLK